MMDMKLEENSNGTRKEYIGQAWLEDDTIVLSLLATTSGGAVGHGMFRYQKSHPLYSVVWDHLGGLEAEEIKPVEPFPEKQ